MELMVVILEIICCFLPVDMLGPSLPLVLLLPSSAHCCSWAAASLPGGVFILGMFCVYMKGG